MKAILLAMLPFLSIYAFLKRFLRRQWTGLWVSCKGYDNGIDMPVLFDNRFSSVFFAHDSQIHCTFLGCECMVSVWNRRRKGRDFRLPRVSFLYWSNCEICNLDLMKSFKFKLSLSWFPQVTWNLEFSTLVRWKLI